MAIARVAYIPTPIVENIMHAKYHANIMKYLHDIS